MVIIFKPTLRCNIKCRHCYVGVERHKYNDMNVDEAIEIISKVPNNSEVVLHGGEPTLLGVGFYEDIVKGFFNTHKFSMQTNATLINEAWAIFIKDYLQGRVSTSFDVCNSLRPIDTAQWLYSIDILKKNKVKPYVVSMLWKGNQGKSQEIYGFFAEQGLSFRLNPIENIGFGRDSFSGIRHDPMQYAITLNKIFDLWFMKPNANILIDPCAEILSFFLLGNSAKKCPFTSGCFAHIMSINPNGDVFPCGGFDTFTDFRYGNLLKQSYAEIFASEKYREAGKRYMNLPEDCQGCEYFPICEGGCRLDAYSYYGSIYKKTSMCAEYKQIFSHIEKRINDEKGDVLDWWGTFLKSVPKSLDM